MLLPHDYSELDAAQPEVFSALVAEEIERSCKKLDTFRARVAMHIRGEHVHLFPALLEAAKRPVKAAGGSSRRAVTEIIPRPCADPDFSISDLIAAMKELWELVRKDRQESVPVLATARDQRVTSS